MIRLAYPKTAQTPSGVPNTVSGDESQLRAMLQEYIPSCLRGVDANPVCTSVRELLSMCGPGGTKCETSLAIGHSTYDTHTASLVR